MTDAFATAVAAALSTAGPAALRHLADTLDSEPPKRHDALRPVLEAAAADHLDARHVAAYLRGAAAGYDTRAAQIRAELVWTGPTTFAVPVRATAQVLTDLVNDARTELILTTYSARPYQPLLDALQAAAHRGTRIWIVVETLHGAGSALQGDQPADAFINLTGVQLWTWTVERRPAGAKMHAKIAVADRTTLLVSSANLTTSGIGSNIEAGLVIRGGTTPRRAAEHLQALRDDGHLVRL
jgi:phosphatidylserine/phosphatidylglycerophosphate/cardiolipin synthase-like enzyme